MSSAKKRDLPEKVRPVCGLPFRWRKKRRDGRKSVVYCRSAPKGPGRQTR